MPIDDEDDFHRTKKPAQESSFYGEATTAAQTPVETAVAPEQEMAVEHSTPQGAEQVSHSNENLSGIIAEVRAYARQYPEAGIDEGVLDDLERDVDAHNRSGGTHPIDASKVMRASTEASKGRAEDGKRIQQAAGDLIGGIALAGAALGALNSDPVAGVLTRLGISGGQHFDGEFLGGSHPDKQLNNGIAHVPLPERAVEQTMAKLPPLGGKY